MNWKFQIRHARGSAGLWYIEARSDAAKRNGGRWFNITEGMHRTTANAMLRRQGKLVKLADKVYRHRYSRSTS